MTAPANHPERSTLVVSFTFMFNGHSASEAFPPEDNGPDDVPTGSVEQLAAWIQERLTAALHNRPIVLAVDLAGPLTMAYSRIGPDPLDDSF